MLEPVARNKLSFRTSGLFQDGRGVVVGQTAVVLLLSVERLVSLLRLLVRNYRSTTCCRRYVLRSWKTR